MTRESKSFSIEAMKMAPIQSDCQRTHHTSHQGGRWATSKCCERLAPSTATKCIYITQTLQSVSKVISYSLHQQCNQPSNQPLGPKPSRLASFNLSWQMGIYTSVPSYHFLISQVKITQSRISTSPTINPSCNPSVVMKFPGLKPSPFLKNKSSLQPHPSS